MIEVIARMQTAISNISQADRNERVRPKPGRRALLNLGLSRSIETLRSAELLWSNNAGFWSGSHWRTRSGV